MPILLKISRRFLPRKGELLMKIVGVAACTVGIAHTYIAREKINGSSKKKEVMKFTWKLRELSELKMN